MKKSIILVINILVMAIFLYGDRFIITNKIPEGDLNYFLSIDDVNRNGEYEIKINSKLNYNIYEHTKEDSFVKVSSNGEGMDSLIVLGIGDLNGDGLYDYVCYNQFGVKQLKIYTQRDSFSFPDSMIWVSKDTFKAGMRNIFNMMKSDSIDRIYGTGIPEVSSNVTSRGWFYYTYEGNDTWAMEDTFMPDSGCFEILACNFDGDSLCDVILFSRGYTRWFEATDTSQRVFEKVYEEEANIINSGFYFYIGDVDKDGRTEIGNMAHPSSGPAEYYAIVLEYNGVNGWDTILNYEFYTSGTWGGGGWMTSGDVDGDGEDELVFSGGPHLEIWESKGDNVFEKEWEWNCEFGDSVMNHSSLMCHDFNGNGYDEIVISGAGIYTDSTYILEDSVITALIDSSVAYEGEGIEQNGIDGDDYVVIYFSNKTNIPEITSQNIDNLFSLSNSHSWLDGVGIIRGAQWSSDSTKLIIYLSDIGDIPTLQIGDTIYPNRLQLKSYDNITPVKGTTILTGTFDPPEWVENNSTADNTNNKIIIKPIKGGINITNYTGDITIYDVSGRIIKTTHITPSNPTIQLNRGIYFIKVGDRIKKVNVVR